MSQIKAKQACVNKKQIVYSKDLPLSCPGKHDLLWNAHPKVFLPIEETGEEICPYCGTFYTLAKD